MPGTGFGNPLRGKNAANIIRISPNMDVRIREIFVRNNQKHFSEYRGTEYFDKLSGMYI